MRFDNAYLTTSSTVLAELQHHHGEYPHNTGAPELHGTARCADSLSRTLEGSRLLHGSIRQEPHVRQQDRAFDKITDGGGPGREEDWVGHVQNRPKDKPFFWLASSDAHRGWAINDEALITTPTLSYLLTWWIRRLPVRISPPIITK